MGMAGRYTNATPGGWFPAARDFLICCGKKERGRAGIPRPKDSGIGRAENALQGPGRMAAAERRMAGFDNQAEPRSLSVVAPRC